MGKRREQREAARSRYVEAAGALAVRFLTVANRLGSAPDTQRGAKVLSKGAEVLSETPLDTGAIHHLESRLGQIVYGRGTVRVAMSSAQAAEVEDLALALEELMQKAQDEGVLDYFGAAGGDGRLTVRDWTDKKLSWRERTERPAGVVVHYTGGGGIWGTLEALKARGLSYHYVVARDGTVYKLVDRDRVAHHAGGEHNRLPGGGIPEGTIGIALANYGYARAGIPAKESWPEVEAEHWNKMMGRRERERLRFEPYPKAQLDALVELTARVLEENRLGPEAVWSHSELSERKSDPGPLFPMEHFKANLGHRLESRPMVGSALPQPPVRRWDWKGPALLLVLVGGLGAAHLRDRRS